MFKASSDLLVPEWQSETVYLVQFPRSAAVPSASPFSLKLETWLRLSKLKYENVSNNFSRGSAKGQIPFVELNGKQIADSNLVIEALTKHFAVQLDAGLTEQQRATARLLTVLAEESLFRICAYDRSLDNSWLFSADKGMLNHMGSIQRLFIAPMRYYMSRTMKNRLHDHGIGRFSPEEVTEFAKKDLQALSTFLGEQKYFFGDEPSTIDATLFGHLTQFTDTPINLKGITEYLREHAGNLTAWQARMKSAFWADWDELLRTQKLTVEEAPKQEATPASTE